MSNIQLKCNYCETKIKWEGHDVTHGTIWQCENPLCNKYFCEKCFIDKHGDVELQHMIHKDNLILCPECYEKLLTNNKA